MGIRPIRRAFAVCIVLLFVFGVGWLCAPEKAPAAPAMDVGSSKDWESFKQSVKPVLDKNCVACHGDEMPEAEVSLNHFDSQESLEKGVPVMAKALNMLRLRKMPPADSTQPSEADRQKMVSWFTDYTTKVYLAAGPNPGHVTLHRLNRSEYNNTIRDLLALDIKPADAFPIDDAGYGFDNNGDVLSIAPVLMERYIDAASLVLDHAMYAEPVVPAPVGHFDASTMEGSLPKSDPKAIQASNNAFTRNQKLGRVLNYNAEIHTDYNLPAEGEYTLRLYGYGKQTPRVQFELDGKPVGPQVTVAQDLPNPAVYGAGKVKLPGGQHTISVVFAGGASKAEYDAAVAAAATRPAATQMAFNGGARGQGANGVNANFNGVPPPGTRPSTMGSATAPAGAAGRNRNGAGAAQRPGRPGAAGSITGKPTVGIVYVEIEGPLEVTPDRMPESYRRVMIVQPSASVPKVQAAEKIIRNFASKAYRRPADDQEVAGLMGLYSKEIASGETFEASIHTALEAVLVSPYFLYRYEREPQASDANGVRTLDEYELASRLSYFLWSSMPDDELITLAHDGKLRQNLAAQVKRMLVDPRSSALVENFAGQWLQLRQLANASPDPKKFPTFDEPLREAMLKETQLYFKAIINEDRSVLNFIDSDFTFMNERLARHYGRTDVVGEAFQRVPASSTLGGGLLTHASVLTITSYTNRTSPVQRGKWVLENLLDAAPPPPPPDIPKLVETSQAEMSGTLRQRMEQHRTNPNCIACHGQMDPIGFGLENFDAIGSWRDKDANDVLIDASGVLPDGSSFQGVKGLKAILMARKDQFVRCMADRLLTYAVGRGMELSDHPMEEQITAAVKQDNYKFSTLVMQTVQSDAFQKRGIKRSEP